MGKRKSRLREENGIRLPKRVWRVIDAARDGQKLTKLLRRNQLGMTEIEFAFEPGGKHVPTGTANAAIASGLLRPTGDGLFGAETSQTWVAA